MKISFTSKDLKDQRGKVFFVTGANTGIGFEVAKALALKNARVLLGCRDEAKAQDAIRKIKESHPHVDIKFIKIDLADFTSIKMAAETIKQTEKLDVLINNAGVALVPYGLTKDGHELQFGINHLGTFLLSALLIDHLENSPHGRIVVTASQTEKSGKIDFEDLKAQKHYSATKQYFMSKLANIVFMHELDRRLKSHQRKVFTLAAHPGMAATEIVRHLPRGLQTLVTQSISLVMNTPEKGAWPTLLAATGEGFKGGEYFGPSQFGERRGPATQVHSSTQAQDASLGKKLWERSEELCHVNFLGPHSSPRNS